MNEVFLTKDVLTEPQRKRLLEDLQPFLKDFPGWPGKQSNQNLHLCSQFDAIFKRFLEIATGMVGEALRWGSEEGTVSFFNETTGRKKDIAWHSHPSDFSGVYYIKTFPFFSNGTLFRDGFAKAPQNSLLIFPSHLEHTAPSSPLRFKRYTMGLNWLKLNQEKDS